jgi:uncharacterized membrane protein YheB (UPF0754 family)
VTVQSILADIQANWLIYAAMPLVAAGIGYVTKLVAIKMMFAPIEFIGIRPFLGWQGIVPRKAGSMAKIACDTLTKNLINPADIWNKVDPQRLVAELEQPMLDAAERITEEVALRYQPGLWQSVGPRIRQRLVQQVQREAPAVVKAILENIGRNVTKVFDLESMIIRALTEDKRVIIRVFKETGREEFAFIRRSGIYFGLGIGMVQAVTWALTHSPWVMPLFGGFVGYASDWLALRMVFRPVEPTRFFGVFTWQGLFLKRRLEVSEIHARLIAEEVLTARNLLEAAVTGPAADQLYAMVSRHVQNLVDEQAGFARPLVVFAMGSERYQTMKNEIAAKLMESLPATLRHAEALMDRELDMHTTLAEKMKLMTPEQFEGVLRPVFRQDEWILVLLGGVLGFLVGELQVFLMLHH